MNRFLFAVIFLLTSYSISFSQSIIDIEINQNPLFEVFTNDVNIVLPEESTNIILGGDIVIKGGSGEYLYCWYDSNENKIGSERTIEISCPGIYSLEVKDTCDCIQTISFNVSSTGLNEIISENIGIFPNPTTGLIKLKGIDAIQLVAVSLSGKVSLLKDGEQNPFQEADLSILPNGIYVITITDVNGKIFTTKLIKN